MSSYLVCVVRASFTVCVTPLLFCFLSFFLSSFLVNFYIVFVYFLQLKEKKTENPKKHSVNECEWLSKKKMAKNVYTNAFNAHITIEMLLPSGYLIIYLNICPLFFLKNPIVINYSSSMSLRWKWNNKFSVRSFFSTSAFGMIKSLTFQFSWQNVRKDHFC